METFTSQSDDSKDSQMTRTESRYRTMAISFALEWFSFGLNLAGALMSNSMTLWANTFRVGLDSLATSFAFLVTHRIAKARDHGFDYGLGKWENLSALINAVVMMAAIIFIVFRSLQRFLNPEPVTGAWFGVSILAFFTSLNIWLLVRFWRLCRHNPSPVFEAQVVMYRNATVASVISLMFVMLSFVAEEGSWMVWLDPVGAMLLCGVIFYGMLTLFQKSLPAILDQSLDESLQLRILNALAKCYDDYEQIHGIRTRHSGNKIFVELFLEFESSLSVGEMLRRADRLKSIIEDMIPHAEVWVIPYDSGGMPAVTKK